MLPTRVSKLAQPVVQRQVRLRKFPTYPLKKGLLTWRFCILNLNSLGTVLATLTLTL